MTHAGFEIEILEPDTHPLFLPERVLQRLYRQWTGMRYAKFPLSRVWRQSRALARIDKGWKPDLIFSLFSASLVFYRGSTPFVYDLDTSFLGEQETYPTFGDLAMRLNVWQERRAFPKCCRVITHSHWMKRHLQEAYRVPGERIDVFPLPCALPHDVVPEASAVFHRTLEPPLRLLLVGRDYRRKGVDIAIEVVRQLNDSGIASHLTVCGTQGEEMSYVKFVGPYKKSDPQQLRQYVDLYKRSDFLLHPAVFEAAGIVPSEAAAFGVPTITNDTGGLGTTVANGESGIVLPKGSRPEAYVQAIVDLLHDPQSYVDLRISTRRRYERELNWDVAAKRVAAILTEAAQEK